MAKPGEKNYKKFSTEELMQLVDLFQISEKGMKKIREIVESEEKVPDAWPLFRYYNDRSKVVEFEEKFSKKMGSKYVLGVNSGTSALIAAMMAAGVAPGDEVIVPGYTFFASVSAIVVGRGIPVIAEVNESLTLDPDDFEKKITDKTKAVVVVHMVGHPAEMDKICEIAKKHNVVVIEDTAQACGGKYKGKYLGTWGDIGCVSLDAYKVIASGEGGIVMTDNEWLYTRAQSWHDTAACWRPNRFARERKEGELFCGENYRMDEMAGAIALAQLEKMDEINAVTKKYYDMIRENVKLPSCAKWVEPADPEGVCGYQVGIIFDSPELAEKAITSGAGIGGLAAGETKGARNWHMYWYWEHILEQKTVTPEGCPFTCPHVSNPPKYTEDMCPETKRIMRSAGFIAVSPEMTEEQVKERIEIINTKLSENF